jgi:hypothetical protein
LVQKSQVKSESSSVPNGGNRSYLDPQIGISESSFNARASWRIRLVNPSVIHAVHGIMDCRAHNPKPKNHCWVDLGGRVHEVPFYLGGWSPGDDSHSLMCEAVSSCPALRDRFALLTLRQSFGSLFDAARFLRQALPKRGGFGLVELDTQHGWVS